MTSHDTPPVDPTDEGPPGWEDDLPPGWDTAPLSPADQAFAKLLIAAVSYRMLDRAGLEPQEGPDPSTEGAD